MMHRLRRSSTCKFSAPHSVETVKHFAWCEHEDALLASDGSVGLRRPRRRTIDSKPQSDKGPSHVWTRAAQKRGIMSPPTDHHSWMQLPRNHRQGAAMRSLPALETQLTGERSSAEDAGKLERRASRGAAWARDLLQIRGTKHPMCTKHPRCRLGPCAAVARPAAVCACRSSSSKGRSTLAQPRSGKIAVK